MTRAPKRSSERRALAMLADNPDGCTSKVVRLTESDSGLFGRELPGKWLNRNELLEAYDSALANGSKFRGRVSWYDFHATL